ncbi:hypothetical protein [Streptomyces luteireticuli]
MPHVAVIDAMVILERDGRVLLAEGSGADRLLNLPYAKSIPVCLPSSS